MTGPQPDLEWIARTEHELQIEGHEDDCTTCQSIAAGLQEQRMRRYGGGNYSIWIGPDGRKFVCPEDGIAWYLAKRRRSPS